MTRSTTDLYTDRMVVDHHLRQLLNSGAKQYDTVHQAMSYAVLGPAQRIRPILTLRVARLFDRAPEDTPNYASVPEPSHLIMRAAVSVELLHCASLIIDDLPCMDDSALRRNQPSVHIRFGEATAVLAAFGLVALAARSLLECSCSEEEREQLVAFQLQLLRSLDCAGLIAGQALDLSIAERGRRGWGQTVNELKTVPLFQLAVAAGTLFTELDVDEAALLNCFAYEFGLAFQVTDDMLDKELPDDNHLQPAILREKLTTLRAVIAPFGSRACQLQELLSYLDERVGNPRC